MKKINLISIANKNAEYAKLASVSMALNCPCSCNCQRNNMAVAGAAGSLTHQSR